MPSISKAVALALLFPFVFTGSAQAEIGVTEMVRGVVEKVVQPGYAAVSSTAQRLGQTMKRLCENPSQDVLDEARSGFGSAVEAWSEIEAIRFGPVSQDNRLERILYWPDRRSIGLKQVQAILADKDATATDIATLKAKSVAVQGFGALEFVLFGTGSEELASSEGAFRCAYGKTIVANIHENGEGIYKAWMKSDGISSAWENPAPENPLYRTDDESISQLVDTILQGLEIVRDVRLNAFLGERPEDDKPKQAIYWRSDRTVASIARNLDGLRRMVEQSDIKERLPADQRWIIESILFEFDNASKALFSLMDEPVAALLENPEKRAKLDYVRVVTSSITETVSQRLTAELGITSGFSSLDGD